MNQSLWIIDVYPNYSSRWFYAVYVKYVALFYILNYLNTDFCTIGNDFIIWSGDGRSSSYLWFFLDIIHYLKVMLKITLP